MNTMYKAMHSTTTNRYVLKRWEGEKIPTAELIKKLPINYYQFVFVSDQGIIWVDFHCPCGYIHSIATNHTISDDGIVMPSVGVPMPPSGPDRNACGFHEWVKLEDWGEELKKIKKPQKQEVTQHG